MEPIEIDPLTDFYNHIYLREFLFRKKVAIIGGWDKGIDERAFNYKIGVRVNSNWQRQGGPCNILYHSGARESAAVLSAYEIPKELLFACLQIYPQQRMAVPWKERLERENVKICGLVLGHYAGDNPVGPEHQWANIFHKDLGTYPYTGMFAIYHLLQMPIRELFVTGMNFYNGVDRGIHNSKRHIEYLKKFWLRDSRLTLDGELLSLIEQT